MTPCDPVDFSTEGTQIEMRDLAKEMVEIMNKNNGVGLAANQIGVNKQIFVLRGIEENLAIINPRIVSHDVESIELEEGCLSYPGLSPKVTRPKTIRVRYANLLGQVSTHNYGGMTARIFQHEFEHLQGKNFTSGYSDLRLRRLLDKARKNGYNYTLNMLRTKKG